MADLEKTLYSDIAQLLEQARQHVRRTANSAMVHTYYEIGRRIIEEEQQGHERAGYGQQVLKGLSEYLTERFGRGFSEDNLGNMRKFYLVYSKDQISETASRKLDADNNLPTIATGRKFFLSWSHYLKLMRISNSDERHFYEIEAAHNDSVKQGRVKETARRVLGVAVSFDYLKRPDYYYDSLAQEYFGGK